MKKRNLGFTMIELLIVIAVLGILAVAVLSTINPIEQINRSRDTGNRTDAEQMIGAVDRFYAANGYYPWRENVNDIDELTGKAPQDWQQVDDTTWVDTVGEVVLTKLASEGTAEVKESFVTRLVDANYNPLFVYNAGGSGESTYVCFAPRSSNFIQEADLRCSAVSGDLPDDYPKDDACGNTSDCGPEGNCVCLP